MNYTVRLADMPTTVHSFVEREDGFNTIVINAKLSYEKQRECYKHEAGHISEKDFESEETADTIENTRHGRIS